MFGRAIPLFSLLGFQIRLDLSWLLLAVLVMWSLARGLFPSQFPGLAPFSYAMMALAGTVGIFASIVLHEFSHAVVARRFGMPISGITLFLFGGVAEMNDQPTGPKAEFLTALAGPVASLALSGVCQGGAVAGALTDWPMPVLGVLAYLAAINLILGVFNLVPAFPLDGGRILRAGLWAWKGDLLRATRIATRLGEGFGVALALLGLFWLVFGHPIAGLWWGLLGLFVRAAARGSYRQLLAQRMLSGVPVRRVMVDRPVTVDPELGLQALVDDYFLRYRHDAYPVAADGVPLGWVTPGHVKGLAGGALPRLTVRAVMAPLAHDEVIQPDADAGEVLCRLRADGQSRLLVVDQGRLVGLVTLRDLLRYLTLRMDLDSAVAAEPIADRSPTPHSGVRS